MLKRRWPVRQRIYWCPNCNVPLLSPQCSRCGGRGVEVKLGPPGDARPALPYDHEKLKIAAENEWGTSKAAEALLDGRRKAVLLNKVPYMDEMKEVIVDGSIIAKLYYDPVEARWRLRPTYIGAKRLLENGLVSPLRLEPGQRPSTLRGTKPQGLSEGDQAIIVDSREEPVAIGYIRKGKLRIVNEFRSRPEPPGSGAEAGELEIINANREELHRLESKGLALIDTMSSKTMMPVVVSYSGGKDSLVALHLTLRAGVEPSLLFNDTGLEFPETRAWVEKVSKDYDLELRVASAGDAFWRAVGFFGPPGRDYRWCCKVAKLAPLARIARKAWPQGALNVVGQRAFESLDRARSGRVWRNRWAPTLLSISPIHYWSQLAIWLYIWKHGLEPNPLYYKGFERLGCFMCPASPLAEFETVKRIHPELWYKWEDILWKWAARINAPKEWVTLGLWRWLGPAPQKLRLARRAGVDLGSWINEYGSRITVPLRGVREVSEETYKVVLELGSSMPIKALLDQHAILGSLAKSDMGQIILERAKLRISFDGRAIEAEAPGKWAYEEAVDALKLIYRWVFCAGCRSCEASCPTNAIKVDPKPRVDPDKCIRCRLCVDNCPIADIYVEHLLLPHAVGDYYYWKREGRRKRKEVVKIARKLLAPAPPTTGRRVKEVAPEWRLLEEPSPNTSGS